MPIAEKISVGEMMNFRVYAGLHYRFTKYKSIEMGQELGNIIASLDLKGEKNYAPQVMLATLLIHLST